MWPMPGKRLCRYIRLHKREQTDFMLAGDKEICSMFHLINGKTWLRLYIAPTSTYTYILHKARYLLPNKLKFISFTLTNGVVIRPSGCKYVYGMMEWRKPGHWKYINGILFEESKSRRFFSVLFSVALEQTRKTSTIRVREDEFSIQIILAIRFIIIYGCFS
jgi:hypothetical protein